METNKIYIVSFSDSKKYLYKESGKEYLSPYEIEKVLNEALSKQFPGETFAYFVTPRMTEISANHIDQFIHYPKLNAEAVEEIKTLVIKEVEDRDSLRVLDSDAPFNNVSPKY